MFGAAMLSVLVLVGRLVHDDVESWRGNDLYDEIVEDRRLCLIDGITGWGDGYDVADDDWPSQ